MVRRRPEVDLPVGWKVYIRGLRFSVRVIDVAARPIAAAMLVVALVLVWAGPAAAHTGFESSEPSDGAVVIGPVTEVVVRFSGPATPTGEGFVVRLPTGDLVESVAAAEDGENSWRLDLPEPVVDGVVAVRWEVQAPDAHPIAGSFSFTVAAADVEPDSEVVAGRVVTDGDEPVDPEVPATSARDQVDVESGVSPSVEEFLAVSDARSGLVSLLGYGGRIFGLGGTIAVIGLLVFVALVLAAGDPERVWLIRSCFPLGMVIVAGAVLEAIALTVGTGDWAAALEIPRWASVIQSNAGTAVVVRAIGGTIVTFGVRAAWVRSVVLVESPIAQMSPNIPTSDALSASPDIDESSKSGVGPKGSWPLVVGVGLLLAVGLFDGHTVTSGQRIMTGLADVVHVFAGGVWVGGVFGLGAVLTSRHRRGVALDGLRLGLRFSRIAALASALAGVTGVALAFIVLEGFDQLIGTSWGRVLIAKVLLVAVAASIGAYNHFVVLHAVPTSQIQSSVVSVHLRRLVAVESMVLIVVIAATALLIASNSVA